jgi:hypothetical protein
VAQAQERQFPTQEGKGHDLLDLLAELHVKAEDVLGTKMGGTEFMEKVFAEGSKQVAPGSGQTPTQAVWQSPEGAAGEEGRGRGGAEGRAAGVACETH